MRHATPRTLNDGDIALYTALYGGRFAVQSSSAFATSLDYQKQPVDDILAFHIAFGKTVSDVSLNAVANFGYAAGVFGAPVFAGDTISARSEVIGLKENSNGKTGVVYVRSIATNQHDEMIVDYKRWVMVHKRDALAPAPDATVPDFKKPWHQMTCIFLMDYASTIMMQSWRGVLISGALTKLVKKSIMLTD